MNANPTVYIVDDDPAMRQSLRWLTESVGLHVATFETAEAFLDNYRAELPGCLVLDVRMPGMSGLDLQTTLCDRHINLPIIIVTGHGEVQSAVRAMKAGAVNFIEKPFSDQDLLDAVRQALEQDAAQREAADSRRDIEERFAMLTPRERQVLLLVVNGRANKQIAAELNISQKTVEVHRSHVMQKLQAQSVAELVHMAMKIDDLLADTRQTLGQGAPRATELSS
jgi:two-component system, LuxR family, response regulator FixJ